MNKFMLSLALGAGLTLSLTAPRVQATPIITTLDTPSISASDFGTMFEAVDAAPVMQSNFQLYNASNPITGVLQSQVFKGMSGTAADGLYAYAYQVSVSPDTTDKAGAPVHLDGTSFIFNGTPILADLGGGMASSAYQISTGSIGGIHSLNGTMGVAPDSLSFQADNYSTDPDDPKYTGTLRANFVNTSEGTPPLYSGKDSATFFVLSNQPIAQNFVNLTSNTPQTGGMTSVYSADGVVISPAPVPEPSTILAWAGMAGAVALVRRVRKSRTVLA